MENALIIGVEGPTADEAIQGLWDADFRSIMRVENPRQALDVLSDFPPRLIMVLPDASSSASIADLETLSEAAGAPIVVATSNVSHALDCLGPTVSLEGPYGMKEVRKARAVGMRPTIERQAA